MTDSRTIVIADHHKHVFVYEVLDRETGESRIGSIPARRPQLCELLEPLPKPAHLFIEACRSWEWVSDLCDDLDVTLHLVDSSKVPEVWRSSKKTDRHDVEALVRRLLAVGELPEAYRASRPERELRGLTRTLHSLRKQKKNILNRIHALVDANGMPATKADFFDEQWAAEAKGNLSADVWLVLETLLRFMTLVYAEAEIVEVRIGELVDARDDGRRLLLIPGVGPQIAGVILAETADIRRFRSARSYAAYTGLVPRVRSSAGKARIGSITRCGPPSLRWALGHAIFASVRCKNPSHATLFYRRKSTRGKPKKVAMCAAAHKLARIVYAMMKNGTDYRPPRRRIQRRPAA